MLNKLAKPLLVASSLAPALFAYGIARLTDGKPVWDYAAWFLGAVMLIVACLAILRASRKRLEKQDMSIKSFKNSDKEVLAFLLAYLLPLAAEKTLDFPSHFAVALFVFAVLFLAILHSNAFDFNPLLGLFGYHFYEIESADGMPFLLITRNVLRRQTLDAEVVQLSDYTFLEIGGPR
jgi:hypothetical protein